MGRSDKAKVKTPAKAKTLQIEAGSQSALGSRLFCWHATVASPNRPGILSSPGAGLVVRSANEVTNEIDAFVRQARRKPQP